MNRQDRPPSSYCHLGLHYRDNADGPRAARLLREFGFRESYSVPSAETGDFAGTLYHFILDPGIHRGADEPVECAPQRVVGDAERRRERRVRERRVVSITFCLEDPQDGLCPWVLYGHVAHSRSSLELLQ